MGGLGWLRNASESADGALEVVHGQTFEEPSRGPYAADCGEEDDGRAKTGGRDGDHRAAGSADWSIYSVAEKPGVHYASAKSG